MFQKILALMIIILSITISSFSALWANELHIALAQNASFAQQKAYAKEQKIISHQRELASYQNTLTNAEKELAEASVQKTIAENKLAERIKFCDDSKNLQSAVSTQITRNNKICNEEKMKLEINFNKAQSKYMIARKQVDTVKAKQVRLNKELNQMSN